MAEQTRSMKREAFGGLTSHERNEQEARLKRIREVSADFLAALERESRSAAPKKANKSKEKT
jgi:hypothetical protein